MSFKTLSFLSGYIENKRLIVQATDPETGQTQEMERVALTPEALEDSLKLHFYFESVSILMAMYREIGALVQNAEGTLFGFFTPRRK